MAKYMNKFKTHLEKIIKNYQKDDENKYTETIQNLNKINSKNDWKGVKSEIRRESKKHTKSKIRRRRVLRLVKLAETCWQTPTTYEKTDLTRVEQAHKNLCENAGDKQNREAIIYDILWWFTSLTDPDITHNLRSSRKKRETVKAGKNKVILQLLKMLTAYEKLEKDSSNTSAGNSESKTKNKISDVIYVYVKLVEQNKQKHYKWDRTRDDDSMPNNKMKSCSSNWCSPPLGEGSQMYVSLCQYTQRRTGGSGFGARISAESLLHIKRFCDLSNYINNTKQEKAIGILVEKIVKISDAAYVKGEFKLMIKDPDHKVLVDTIWQECLEDLKKIPKANDDILRDLMKYCELGQTDPRPYEMVLDDKNIPEKKLKILLKEFNKIARTHPQTPKVLKIEKKKTGT
ncbi:MAG: hypothetical protein NkDv07_0483 [Candidatus Improbicoccus devescovinae]|nr:MAG: hypothetical protein NkDv07_0483 [Candidatus Improbicoccus devescovinae]